MPRPEKIKTLLGQRLTDFRKHLGYEQRPAFSKILGVSKVTLGNYERGDREPDLQFLLLYAEKFNANLHWLATGAGEMFYESGGESPPLAKADINAAHLQKAVQIVEKALADIGLTADKKAELINLVCAMLKAGRETGPISRIIDLLRP